MKKQLSLFIWAVAVFGMSPVLAATNSGMRAASSADLTGGPAVRSRQNVNYQKYQTRTSTKTYQSTDGKNIYYSSPSRRSDLYKAYDNGNMGTTTMTKTVRTSRVETTRRMAQRKYYLAHPFFQPLKGKFGSVTDLAYTMNSYDFDIASLNGDNSFFDELSGKWDMSQFSIKEDFSYGITDTLALMAMARFDFSDYKFKWNMGEDDKMDDSGLNLFGLGAQWRFVDNEKWIGAIAAHFQHQKDLSNNYMLEAKGGYKYGKSTIYGLGRVWYVDYDGDVYGNGIENDVAAMLIAYSDDNKAFYVEGGLGVFSVLDEDWTLNIEGIVGHYDWNTQASVKGAIGWQPNDWFALNLYAKTSFYNSADGDKLDFYWREPAVGYTDFTHVGTAKIDSYTEASFGLQTIFYF